MNAGLLWMGLGVQLCAGWASAQNLPGVTAADGPLLTNAAQVVSRSPRDRLYPLRITGTVTFYDPAWPILFVQDDTDALYVPVPPNPSWRIATSNRVTLEAEIGPSDVIESASIRVVEANGQWPAPLSITVENLESGRNDKRYVRLRGILRSATRKASHFVLQLHGDNGRPFQVTVPTALVSRGQLGAWLDAELDIRGVCGSVTDAEGKPVGYQLWLPGKEHVAILRPPAPEFISSNVVKIAAAKVFDIDRNLVDLQVVSGIVTWVESDREFYFQDDTAGTDAHLREPLALKAGMRVEVAGVPAGDAFSFYLNHAVARVLAEGETPRPVALEPQTAMRGNHWAMLVSVSGYVLDGATNADEVLWNVRSQDHFFTASLATASAGELADQMRPGARVEFTGICLPNRDHLRVPRSFEIAARSPSDIRVLAGATWARIQLALPLIGGAMALAVLAGGWALMLRYQVRRQTRQIREHLVHTTALEERFRDLFENASDLVFTCDWAGQITQVNQTVERLTGYPREDALKMSVLQWAAPEDAAKLQEALQQQRAGQNLAAVPVDLLVKGGKRLHLELSACPLYRDGQAMEALVIARDLTERRHLEEQLRQAQKMEAVGQLAGGVAHDFNNILTAVLMQVQFLQDESGLGSEAKEGLAEIESEAKRAAALTRQLLMFSRRQVLQAQTLELNALLGNLLKMLRRLIGEHITLEFNGAPGDLWINADPGMLEQVVVNLVVNARDAMSRGGRITLTTQLLNLEAADCTHNREARPGRFVNLVVTDTGCGMDAATQEHIFEPFFTTKEVGKGTGLGLATVYGIVKQHQGWVEVDSRPGEGSAFRVCLPAIAPPRAADQAATAQPSVPRGRETILVVEDGESVRRTISQLLQRLGYRVLEAGNSEEALALWPREREHVALVLADMIMPGRLNGQELLRQLRQDKPALKCLLMSGYSQELVNEGISDSSDTGFLPKPVELATLAEKIRNRLDGR